MKRNPRLLSTLEMERLIATSAISEAEYLEPDSKETSSWMAYHMGLMPVTDWLLRGIYPYLRAELLNKAFPGKYRTLPAINLNTSEMGAMYKRGIGRNTILGAQFPPFHVPGADYATLSQKANQSNAAFTRKLKSGDYQSTATLGNSRFLYMHYKDISDGSFVDAFSILRAYDVEDMVAMTRDAKHRKNIVKVFGEDFFDLQNPYQRTFPMAKSFSQYLEEAVSVPVHEFITQLLTEMDPAEWVYDEVVDEDDEADVAYIATRYISWLDKNIRTFDIIAAPQTPSGFPTLRADGGKKIEIVSLSDPQLAQAQMPEGAKTYLLDQSAYFKDTYTAYDFFVDCVLSCREASIHVMVNIPKNVAQWVTQGKDKADDYYLVQILSQAQAELEDYETYQKSPTIAGCVGDQSAGTYANAPIEDTASRLEKRKVNALGVNEKGLGVDDQGRFIYVPTKLNHLGKNRKEIEEYFDAIQVNKGSRILALRDPFDISGNVRVIGKDVTQRPRPKQIGTEVKPLYIDWGIGVLAGISNRGSIIPLLDLKHITKLEDNHYRNYYNAALYPVVTRDNGKWAKSLTDILTATKPNQYNAVTEPLSRIVQKFMPLAVSTDDLTAWAMAEFREVFKTRNVDGMDIELIMNEGTIENSSRIIGRSLAGNDPIGTMTTAIYGPYYSSYHRLMNLFSDESAIPAEFDDIVNIATNGFGDYFTLKDLAKDWTRSPSILTRLFGRILDKIWDLTENRLEMFYEITSVELAHRYYGTISAISDLMRNPRSISPVVHDTSKPAPADYKAEPLAGGREGYAMLPHQVRVDYHNTQMIKDDVKVEILDAQAGAGKCLVGSTLAPTSRGLLRFDEIFNKFSEQIEGDTHPFDATVLTTQGYAKTDSTYTTKGITWKVVLKNGIELEGLPEHRLWVMRDGKFEFVRLDKLKQHDALIRTGSTGLFGKKTSLRHLDIPTGQGADTSINKRKTKFPVKMDEFLAELLGWIVAEGNTTNSTFSINQHSSDMNNRIYKIATTLFGKDSITQEEFRVRTSTPVANWLRGMVGETLSAHKYIPLEIRTAPRKIVAKFLSALFEGDGTVYTREDGRPYVEYTTISKELAEQVHVLLENFGIYCDTRISDPYESQGGEACVYTVSVNRDSWEKFALEIGFISKGKRNAMKGAVAYHLSHIDTTNFKSRGSENQVPFGDLVNELTLQIEEAYSGDTYVTNENGNRVRPVTLNSLLVTAGLNYRSETRSKYGLNNNGWTTRNAVDQLLTLVDSLVGYKTKFNKSFKEKVEFLREHQHSMWTSVVSSDTTGVEQQVYDLTVPGPHNYACMGILSHNTHNILMDVMRRLDANLIKRPLVICPDYLIKNYIEDGAYIYEGRLNVVPLVTLVKNYDPLYGVKSDPMGLEGMLQLVENAPPNTLFVTSYSFLSAGSQSTFTVPIGTDVVYINPHLEMMLEAGFDYICADEFHELRNEGTTKSDMAKALFYRATYRKGATGTFLNTSPSDIPSQTSMLDPTIFGSTSDFFEYYADSDGGKSNRISKLREGRKENLVQSLRGSTGYTQVKRKEWAALLPERKDSYHVLQLDENSVQWRIYQAILQQVLDEIARILEKNKDITRGAESGDEEANENLEALLRPYLQRLEMLLITPALDKDYQILVEGMDLDYDENYVSPAVERTIKIIEAHLYGVSLEGMDQTERGDAIAEHEDFLDLDSITDIDNVKMLPPTPGKILVFCNYNTSVQATYNALPSHLKEQAIMYDAKNKDKHIFEFKNNPNKKILIGIQTSLATGHNFQFCTRLIRQEQVWSPGEVEQGESRINRPDPKNRDNVRGKIFYDWIVIDGTIQVTKLARLISRQVVNTEIEEFGNPAYKDVPHMPILIMNLGTIRNNCWFHAPSDVQAGVVTSRSLLKYLETKRTIDAIQKREYAEWIADYDGPTEPVEVAVKPPIEGSAVIVNIPPIPGQTIANADRFDVVNVAKYETMMGSQDINLVGMKCLTPEGDGEIVRVSGSKLHVVINGTKYSFDRLAVNIYLESGVSREDLLKASGLKKFVDVTGAQVTIGKGSSKKKKADLTDEEILKELNLPKKKKREPELVSMDELYSQSVDFLKSRSQDAEPKVIKTTKRSKPVPEPTDSETGEPDNTIEVMASATNGALCIMLSSEDADLLSRKNTRILKNMGYNLDPDCWYAEIPNKKTLEVLISKLESKFDIPEKQLDLLYEVLDAFSLGRRKLLNAEHSSLTEIKEYWLQDNRRALRKDPNALVPMPVVQDGNLFIMLDMEHPASKRAKRLRIPNVTWDSSGGLWMKMYSSKKAVAADMRALQELFVIADKDTLKEDIKAINISNGTKR